MNSAPTPPRRRSLRLVAGLLLVVAAIVGLTAYAILTAPGLPEEPPTVTLVLDPGDPGAPRVVRVTEASPELPLSSFRATLVDIYASTSVFAATLRPGTIYANGTTSFSYEDLTVPGRLSLGDEFRLTDFPPGTSYSFTLVHVASQRSLASVTIPL